jgi:hypothetical protein
MSHLKGTYSLENQYYGLGKNTIEEMIIHREGGRGGAKKELSFKF